MTVAEGLTRALVRAGVPVVSVSIGSESDRSTWAIEYTTDSTTQQQTTGEAIRLAYNIGTDTASTDEDAAARLDDKRFKAIAVLIAQLHGIPIATVRSQLITIYKGLPG